MEQGIDTYQAVLAIMIVLVIFDVLILSAISENGYAIESISNWKEFTKSIKNDKA